MRTQGWLAGLAAVVLAGCGAYGPSTDVTYGEIVYTQPKPGQSFAGLTKYYLDPLVLVANDDPARPLTTDLPASVAATFDANMAALGWTKLGAAPTVPSADTVWVQATVFRGKATYYYPGYWCKYWPSYGCYYGWAYAGTYQYGTVVFEMAQFQPDWSNQLPVVWAGAFYGVATSPAYDLQRLNDALGRAFSQSPYLAH